MKYCLLAVAVSAVASQISSALVIRSYNPSSHDRFLGFGAGSAQHNPSFIHSGLDLSGVGWDSGNVQRQLTLVSPRHFVGANHFKPPVGATLRFLAADGTLRSYVVAQREAIPNAQGEASDLFVGTLATDVPSNVGVRFHPYLNLPAESSYATLPLVVLGKNARGGRAVHSGAFTDIGEGSVIGGGSINATRMYSFSYSSAGLGADDCHAEPGDSGSPTFVSQDGIAALVGTHSLVASTNGPLGLTTHTTFDTFVPHYIDELNALMSAEGYHMTAATPASTTVALTQSASAPVIRAGYPVTIQTGLENTGGADANNVRLTSILPPGAQAASGSGADWVSGAPSGGTIAARRGGLASGATAPYNVTLTVPQPGAVQHEVQVSADEFDTQSSILALNVVESFRSWSAGLADPSPGSDGDRDGIKTLLEYAFGGDPTVGSQYQPVSNRPLLPRVAREGGMVVVRYLRRRDAAERLLQYTVEFSHNLQPGSWLDASSVVLSTEVTPLSSSFEEVAVTLSPSSAPRCFLRVRIDLSE